jgi:hypothetical protein
MRRITIRVERKLPKSRVPHRPTKTEKKREKEEGRKKARPKIKRLTR